MVGWIVTKDASVRQDRQKKLLFVAQEKYIENVLERFQMTDAKPLSVPLQPQVKLSNAYYPEDKDEQKTGRLSHMLQVVDH